MSSTNKKRSSSGSKAGTSQGVVVKDASRKRQAKKWSKDKTRQKQKELDGEVNAIYAANIAPVELLVIPQNTRQDGLAAVQALEETLRSL